MTVKTIGVLPYYGMHLVGLLFTKLGRRCFRVSAWAYRIVDNSPTRKKYMTALVGSHVYNAAEVRER